MMKPGLKRLRITESATAEKWAEEALSLSFVEADAKVGKLWEITIIESGLSKNGRFYSPEVLKASLKKFEDSNVYVHKFSGNLADHLPEQVRAAFPAGVAGNLVGFINNVRFKESADGKSGALVGDLHVTATWLRDLFKNLAEAGRPDKLGFSIDVEGLVSNSTMDGKPVKAVESIENVYAVDVVTYPAAGGKLNRMLASEGDNNKESAMNREKMLAFLKMFAGSMLESVDLAKISEAEMAALAGKSVESMISKIKEAALADMLKEVLTLMKSAQTDEAMNKLMGIMDNWTALIAPYATPYRAPASATPAAEAKPVVKPVVNESDPAVAAKLKELEDAQKTLTESLKASQLRESQATLKARLSDSGLPQPVKDKVLKSFEGQVLTEAAIDKEITDQKDLMAKLSESGAIRGMGSEAEIVGGKSKAERIAAACDLMVGYKPAEAEKKNYEGVRPFDGLREAYREITGDRDVRWNRKSLDKRMIEAIVSDFPKLLGDSITRKLLQAYNAFPENWRKLASIRPINDFRTQRRIQWGYFGDLAVVAEDAAFTSLSNPTEKEATYAAQKRGKKFAITREMILQDDLRKLQQIPVMLARSANRTLEQFVFNLLIGNVGGGGINTDLIYDATVLYTAGHANKGVLALDPSTLRAARIRTRKQKDEGAVETLGLKPRYLWVPLDLEPTANVIVNSEKLPDGTNANNINDNFKAVEVVGVPYLGGDTNNWYLSVDPADLEGIEVGFIGGQEAPEVLVQDDPKTGDVFTNERITYKVRHEYGGAVLDFRAFDGSIVP